jgi:hypothetical protein
MADSHHINGRRRSLIHIILLPVTLDLQHSRPRDLPMLYLGHMVQINTIAIVDY